MKYQEMKFFEIPCESDAQCGPGIPVIHCTVSHAISLIYICYSPAERSVLGKTVPDVLDTARGRRPRAVSKTEGTVFPNTDRPECW